MDPYWDDPMLAWDDGTTLWDGGSLELWVEQPAAGGVWIEQDIVSGMAEPE